MELVLLVMVAVERELQVTTDGERLEARQVDAQAGQHIHIGSGFRLGGRKQARGA